MFASHWFPPQFRDDFHAIHTCRCSQRPRLCRRGWGCEVWLTGLDTLIFRQFAVFQLFHLAWFKLAELLPFGFLQSSAKDTWIVHCIPLECQERALWKAPLLSQVHAPRSPPTAQRPSTNAAIAGPPRDWVYCPHISWSSKCSGWSLPNQKERASGAWPLSLSVKKPDSHKPRSVVCTH